MTRTLYILIACCLQIGLQASAQELPPWSPPPPLNETNSGPPAAGYDYVAIKTSLHETNITFKSFTDQTNTPTPPTDEQMALAHRPPQGSMSAPRVVGPLRFVMTLRDEVGNSNTTVVVSVQQKDAQFADLKVEQ